MRELRLIAIVVLAFAAMAFVLFMSAQALGVRSALFAFTVAGATLGFIVVTRPVVHWRLPAALLAIAGWERGGNAYSLLGVSAFGALLRRPPLRWFNSTVYVGNRRGVLAVARDNVVFAEAAHFWALLLTLPLLAWLSIRGAWAAVCWIVLFDTLFNVYPVLHLRMMRARMERVIGRLAAHAYHVPARSGAPAIRIPEKTNFAS